MTKPIHPSCQGLLLVLACLGTGCGNQGEERQSGVQQTGFPGQFTAGGSSSGEVLSRASQATRSTAPAGTPGIPQGSGGNTSGAAMGGTSLGTQQQIEEKAKQSLAAAMDANSERWRSRAAANGWPVFAPTPVQAIAGFNASATQSGPSGQPGGRPGSQAEQAPVQSEKSGTAPASEDVKTDAKPQSPPGIKANSPDKVN
ncbi:MAG: hypothetical protein JWR60_3237 [Polaromonas sp.]|nr:hypothetical protein [Polaromonas sp.]